MMTARFCRIEKRCRGKDDDGEEGVMSLACSVKLGRVEKESKGSSFGTGSTCGSTDE